MPAPAPVPQPKSPDPGSSSPLRNPVKQPLPVVPKPASEPAPKAAPKLPAPAHPNHKPGSPPTSQPAPNTGSKPAKPKSGAGPSIVPDIKPKTGQLPKIPKLPKMPHIPAGGSNGGHSKQGDSKKLGGCNVNCRNALLGTFSALALLGLLGVVIFCIFRRRKNCKRDTEGWRRSKSASYSDGRRWWKQGQSNSKSSEDGMELTTPTAGGASSSTNQNRLKAPQVYPSERSTERSTASYDRGAFGPAEEFQRQSEELSTNPYHMETPSPLDGSEVCDRERNVISHRGDVPHGPEAPQMHSQEQSTGSNNESELMSTRPDRSSDSIMTARSISPCESCVLQRARMHNHEQSTSLSGVRKPISIESDKSSCEDPIPETAQSARIVRHPPIILTIAGMQGFRAGECELQRRNARRNSDRPDMSESRHQSLKSVSSDTFVIGEGSDEADSEDTCTVTDNDDASAATDDEDSRGRTGQKSSNGSARMKGEERLKDCPENKS